MSKVLLTAVVSLARGWVRLYTMGTDRASAERRRAELESDLWESVHPEGPTGAPVLQAIEVVDRLIRGVPADLLWRLEARSARTHSPEETGVVLGSAELQGPRSLTRIGTLVFQVIAFVAVLGAITEVTRQLLRVGDFKAAVPLSEPWQVALVVTFFCIPPLTALAACALAVPLVIKADQLEEARTLALFLAFLSLFWAAVFSFFYFLPSTEPDQLNFGASFGGRGASAWVYTWCVLAIVSFLRFSALFPRRLTARGFRAGHPFTWLGTIQRISLHPSVVWGFGAVLIFVMAAPSIGNPYPRGSEPWTRGAPPVDITWHARWILAVLRMVLGYLLVPLGMITIGVLNLLSGLLTSTGDERRRSMWIFAGFSTALWMVLVSIPLAFVGGETLPEWLTALAFPGIFLAPAVIVACLAVAIFYRGDLDPALMVRRSTVYGLSAVAFVGLYAAGESLLSDFLVGRLGLPGPTGSALIAGLSTMLVLPLRRRLRGAVDRVGPSSASVAETRANATVITA